jgi:hypothetical protein
MRCPACNASNKSGVWRCRLCGGKLDPQARRKEPGSLILADNPVARTAYHCSLFALIPLLGLILGPVAFVLGFAAWRQERRDPTPWGWLRAGTAMFLGSIIAVTSWVGVALMVFGLTSASGR